jgi:hypothetical protein
VKHDAFGHSSCTAAISNRTCTVNLTLRSLQDDIKSFQALISEVGSDPKNRELQNFIKVQSGASMNGQFYEYHRDQDIPASLSRMLFSLARLRLALLRKLGWRGLIRFSQHRSLLKDVVRGLVLLLFHGTKLRESSLVRMGFRERSGGASDRRATLQVRDSDGVRCV